MPEALHAAEAGFDVIQTEKFNPQQVAELSQALSAVAGRRPLIAAAGGITAENAGTYASAGADIIVTSAPYLGRPCDVRVSLTPASPTVLLDLTTGEFNATEYAGAARWQALDDEVRVLKPRELVIAEAEGGGTPEEIARLGVPLTRVEPWQFDPDGARRTLVAQLKTRGLEGFGLEGHDAAVAAAGALVAYLRDSQKAELTHVGSVSFREQAGHLLIDPVTLKHLEILEGADGGRQGALLDELDQDAAEG